MGTIAAGARTLEKSIALASVASVLQSIGEGAERQLLQEIAEECRTIEDIKSPSIIVV